MQWLPIDGTDSEVRADEYSLLISAPQKGLIVVSVVAVGFVLYGNDVRRDIQPTDPSRSITIIGRQASTRNVQLWTSRTTRARASEIEAIRCGHVAVRSVRVPSATRAKKTGLDR